MHRTEQQFGGGRVDLEPAFSLLQLQVFKELSLVATKRMGGSHAQVSRPVTRNPARHKGALRTATIKRRPRKSASRRWRLAPREHGRLNPAAVLHGPRLFPKCSGTSKRKFLGCFSGLKGKRRTKWLIFRLDQSSVAAAAGCDKGRRTSQRVAAQPIAAFVSRQRLLGVIDRHKSPH
jgi:hypothetical protein